MPCPSHEVCDIIHRAVRSRTNLSPLPHCETYLVACVISTYKGRSIGRGSTSVSPVFAPTGVCRAAAMGEDFS
jgi:hypothetical protein